MIRFALGVLAALALSAGLASAAPLPDLGKEIAAYRTIVTGEIHQARLGADELVKTLAAGDRPGARAAWIKAREGWERSETITGPFFGDLDKAIDGWPTATGGFHAVEAALFGEGKLDEILPVAKKLAADLASLETQVAKAEFTLQGLYNGMANLAYEVGESKSKGNESKLSGTSLADIRNNVTGVETLYATVFAKAFEAVKPDIDAQVRKQIAAIRQEIAVADISKIDPQKLEKVAEMLAVTFVDNAPALGLQAPTLESDEDAQ